VKPPFHFAKNWHWHTLSIIFDPKRATNTNQLIYMFKAIIIEDELNAANLLEGMLLDLYPSMEIMDKCKDLPSGVKSIRKHKPEVVFLDIELPVYSGIQLLDFFDQKEIDFQIIFTTAYNQYAINAFEMSATDYLLKPIQEEKLRTAVEKVVKQAVRPAIDTLPILRQNLQHDANKKIVVPVINGYEILNSSDICYLKAEGSYTQIYNAKNNCLLVSKNLKYFESILSQVDSFSRIHRSYMANMQFAKKILRSDGGFLVMENKTELPISDDKMEHVLELLNRL
jgi:two-component system LytT family response regulator